ncbi:spore germination protein [Bacillus sp. JJ634]
MPAITGPIQISHMGSGTLQFGDSAVISPKSASKTINGSGASNTGAVIATVSAINGTNVLDVNGVDQPIAGNN